MVESDYLIRLLRFEHEERFLEYKESLPWDDLKQKITRTAMGMANIRDGGTIIVGVPQRSGRFVLEGMSEEHMITYEADEVQAYVNRFADPYVHLEVHPVEWGNKKFIALIVHEFDQVPIVCKRNSGSALRQGAIYTRSNRVPETCEVQSQTEMREIIEMATEKGVRHFLERVQHVGIQLDTVIRESGSEPFDRQLEEL